MYNTEIRKLVGKLNAYNIPCELVPCYDGWQVCYPAKGKNCVCDAICHSASYGHELDLLEIMGLVPEEIGDDVEGYLMAEEVFRRIYEHYTQSQSATSRVTFTYDTATDCYTEECNANMDYIIRSLPGVKVVAEENGLVQVEADKRAAEVLDFLNECDVVCIYKGETIENVKDMIGE